MFRGLVFRCASDVSGDADVLQGSELGEQVVELEDETDLLVSELCQSLVVESVDLGAVDEQRALVGTVKGADDVQQCRFSGA